GTVLQKKGLRWINWKKAHKHGYLRYFGTWLSGIILSYFLSAIPLSMASKVLPPHVVTAMSGWGIVVIIFLSFFFLKERVYPSDIVYSIVIVGCTLAIGLLTKPAYVLHINRPMLNILFVVPFGLLVPLVFKAMKPKVKAALLACFSGCMGGIAIVFFNIMVRDYFSKGFAGIPKDILALYLLSAVAGAIAEQGSYKIGTMTVVASIRLGLFIIYPVICSALLFQSRVDEIQVLCIALIILSCYKIFKKR
ncbi:MAG: hypothetical protein N2376_00895, partial [Clostridia bacterium]|nr:hypothetical protein [Clostridia bacterium]